MTTLTTNNNSNATEIDDRSKQIQHGTILQSMENMVLGLPVKLGPTQHDLGTVSANPWSFSKLLCQEKLLHDGLIQPSDTSGSTLWSFRHDFKTVFDTHLRNLSGMFCLYTWDIKFRFQIRSNFQQVGMLMLAFNNQPAGSHYLWQFDETGPDIRTVWQFPHRKILLGEDSDFEIVLRWNSPWNAGFRNSSFSTFEDKDVNFDMGILSLYSIFPMTVSVGVDPVASFRVWSSLENVSYSGYYPQDKLF